MKKQKLAAIFCAAVLSFLLPIGASAADTGMFRGGLMREAESLIEDAVPGDSMENGITAGTDTAMETTSTLGDTADETTGDGVVEGTADGYLGDESEWASDTQRDTASDTETETAVSSSGEEDARGMGWMGVVLVLLVIAAGAALLFVLMPKRRGG